MKFCLIGTGVGAALNAEAVNKISGSRILAVSGSNEEHLLSFAKKHNIPANYQNVRQMLEKERPEAIIIASIPTKHIDDILLASEFVDVIVVEKPLVTDMESVAKIEELIRKKNLSISIIYQLRYDEAYNQLKNNIAKIKEDAFFIDLNISSPRESSYYEKSGSWRKYFNTSGGGVLMQNGIHYLNYIFSLFNYDYSLINVKKFYQSGIETEGAVQMNFLIGNKITCDVFFSRMSSLPNNSLHIFGENSSFLVKNGVFKEFSDRGQYKKNKLFSVFYKILNYLPFKINIDFNGKIGTHKDFLIDVINKNSERKKESLFLEDAIKDIILIDKIYKL